ncbi:unnamed protein product [Camellia sinensis]
MTYNNCGKVGHNRRSYKVKGRLGYMQESQPQGSQIEPSQPQGSQTKPSQPQGSQTKPSQPQSQLSVEAPKVKRRMRQKKLAVKRRVVQGSQSTSSPISSNSTPKDQMVWRGKPVYNASGIKSASTGQKDGAPRPFT